MSKPANTEVASTPPPIEAENPADELARLRYENEKLNKINRVLMRRVEMGWGNHSDAYQSFEDAAMLADKVKSGPIAYSKPCIVWKSPTKNWNRHAAIPSKARFRRSRIVSACATRLKVFLTRSPCSTQTEKW